MVIGVKNCMLTGPPGAGKSSLLFEIIDKIENEGIPVEGIASPEIRRDGKRWGFHIKNLKTDEQGILASIELDGSPRVSKYGVNLEDLNDIGVKALKNALEGPAKVVAIDEIGKMELKSRTFVDVTKKLLNSNKMIIGVLYYKPVHPLIQEIKSRGDTKVYWVTEKKSERERNEIKQEIVANILHFME